MRIALCTDAWHPQINGVVRSLAMTVNRLVARGYAVELITPQQFRTVPCPGYSEIRLALAPRFGTRRALAGFAPDVVHIATEGPIGWSARSWCQAHGVPFTTAFHTRFPDYAAVRTGLDAERFWPLIRRFHAPARAVLVSTHSLGHELESRGLNQWRLWSRGIDPEQFHPGHAPLPEIAALPGPIQIYVGRIAVEKNLPAFLEARTSGTKVVVGDGPDLAMLRDRYPEAKFLGAMSGERLARAYCSADVFVFPSRTDTFGLVLLEAMASGVPVAALPVRGPIDVVTDPSAGILNDDLREAALTALLLDRDDVRRHAERFSWERCTRQFASHLVPARGGHAAFDASAEPEGRPAR
jgi:glycosyltransferase involved in cell wall biosynthesis